MKTSRTALLAVLVIVLMQSSAAWSFGSHVNREVSGAAGMDSGKVWIVRGDGAQSCGIKEGQSIESVAQELKKAGVTVYESRKGSDGKMHAMACGMPEGSVNAFLILQSDLPKALGLGFAQAPKGFSGK